MGVTTFFVIVAPMSWWLGVIGAAIAYVIGYAAIVTTLLVQVWGEYRRRRPRKAKAVDSVAVDETTASYLD